MSAIPDPLREAARHLITSIALITTQGKNGPNVMSAEWAFNVSYKPMRLAILIHENDATHDYLTENKEFGANFLTDEQGTLANLGGAYTGKEVNKLSSELFQTYPAKKIQPPMIAGCYLNAECRVVQVIDAGDHTMFLADVLEIQYNPEKSPLLYSQRKFWYRGATVEKKPLVYVTCTVSPEQVRIDGRLLGAETNPQTVSLRLTRDDERFLEESAQTDEYGYFELIHPHHSSIPKGTYVAEAAWHDLTGKATSRLE